MTNYKLLIERGKEWNLTFDNPILVDLWNEELRGQISDGYWENTKNSGWPFWCSINVSVGEENKFIRDDGGNYLYHGIKRNFGFIRLIPYVGDRMVEIGLKHDPEYNEKKLRKDLQLISKIIKGEN